jgi:hypothetical protein
MNSLFCDTIGRHGVEKAAAALQGMQMIESSTQ